MKRKRIENYVLHMNEQLGKGSFGKVFKGVNETTNEMVAIKCLSKKQIDHDDYVKDALVSEIKIMRKLKSNAIVGFIDILETSNNYYVIQELCDGGDLKTALKQIGHYSEAVAIENLKQICTGYQQLINNSIIHRDIKPENILINEGKLKLADFGFAKNVVAHNTMHKSMVGTPLYMAPQILKRQKYTSKCDVWSMGVLFYQMLFGCLPWIGHSEYELVTVIQQAPLNYPKGIPIGPKTSNFLEGCLQPTEQKRFSWQQIYDHPIFEGYYQPFTEKNKKLTERAGYVINRLRVEIHAQNIDLEKLFNKLKYSKASSLNKPQFFTLLRTLNQDITEEQCQFVFTKFDQDGSGTIEFEEFKQQLEEHGVRMKSIKLQPGLQKKHTVVFVQNEGPENEQGDERQERIAHIVAKLSKQIEQRDLDLFVVYDSYDKHHTQNLKFEDFSKLLLKIDSKLTEDELEMCFEKFDINGDGNITFDEFYRTVCKIAGSPYAALGRSVSNKSM